jgi:protein-disulfide isomerase
MENYQEPQQPQSQSLSIPIAIILAGALVAGGIYLSGRNNAPTQVATNPTTAAVPIESLRATDHVLGDRKAPITVIEYSDFECPYCKQFHATIHQLMNEYGVKGQISWVFRHYPVHTNSIKEGQAAECAAEVGGNEAFWKYADKLFATTQSNNGLDLAQLPVIAEQLGLDVVKFQKCLDSGKYEEKINKDLNEVTAAGAQGTPYTVIFKDKNSLPITRGAIPYSEMKQIIEAVLNQ